MKNLTFLYLFILLTIVSKAEVPYILNDGELTQWHKVTLVIPGPQTSEYAKENPFLDYKLEVTFTNGNKSYTVPGFYATDGNAAETSADAGNIWKVRFRPDEPGEWEYKISFRKGKDIVVKKDGFGEPVVSADGLEGSFTIDPSDKTGKDFRAKGRIVNGGEDTSISKIPKRYG